jgi:hypothetical protein
MEEMTPLIVKAPINDSRLQGLFHSCAFLCERLSYLDTCNLNEFAQNNYEFLDTLKVIILRISEYHKDKSLKTEEKLKSLKVRIDIILDKLNTSPFSPTHKQALSDESLHGHKSDEDFTEPLINTLISF